MNTKFLLSPAYLCSAALLVFGAVLSGGRFMMIGWILVMVGLFLNALVLVVLTNRDQLSRLSAPAPSTDALDGREPVVQRVADAEPGEQDEESVAAPSSQVPDVSAAQEPAEQKNPTVQNHAAQKVDAAEEAVKKSA